MPTYKVVMVVQSLDTAGLFGPTKRTVTTQFAGCVDEADAKAKAVLQYAVVKFKTVELAKKEKK